MPDGMKMKSVEKGGWKYLGILEFYNVKQEEMKDRIKREYMREVRNLLKSKLNGGNTISTINRFHCKICSRNYKVDKDRT